MTSPVLSYADGYQDGLRASGTFVLARSFAIRGVNRETGGTEWVELLDGEWAWSLDPVDCPYFTDGDVADVVRDCGATHRNIELVAVELHEAKR